MFVYTYATWVPGALRGLKKVLELLEMEVMTVGDELLCGCCKLDLGPLEEQPELFIDETSLQSKINLKGNSYLEYANRR